MVSFSNISLYFTFWGTFSIYFPLSFLSTSLLSFLFFPSFSSFLPFFLIFPKPILILSLILYPAILFSSHLSPFSTLHFSSLPSHFSPFCLLFFSFLPFPSSLYLCCFLFFKGAYVLIPEV